MTDALLNQTYFIRASKCPVVFEAEPISQLWIIANISSIFSSLFVQDLSDFYTINHSPY